MTSLWVDALDTPWRYNRMTHGYQRLATDGQWLPGVPDGPLQQVTTGGTPPVRTVTITSFELWRGTQAQYDAIPTKNPTTLYVIT